jgi:hypothetical protein
MVVIICNTTTALFGFVKVVAVLVAVLRRFNAIARSPRFLFNIYIYIYIYNIRDKVISNFGNARTTNVLSNMILLEIAVKVDVLNHETTPHSRHG